ncbi:CpxP family protein [Marinomonas sp. M1K-6]|uniref:CpxP family protein n=1 Tax=Marinomonas profundi TaxID=2726122 RepID=A0A847RCF2_9GAMM|nr:CpxP family protein [Marinomonas profundi]NLQ17880.1 CpxP family protein [Marinomonas profundi]UDV03464.1 CpxP family protein [Marinomonas profundi]
MNMTKRILLAAVVLPLTLGTASAFAFGGKDHRGSHEECRPGLDRGIMKELDLTDSQKEQFKQHRQANQEAMKKRFKDNAQQNDKTHQARFNAMNDLLLAETFDSAKATALVQKMSDKQTERHVNMLNKQHDMLSILTPEQKTKFTELQKARMNKCADSMPSHKGKDRR